MILTDLFCIDPGASAGYAYYQNCVLFRCGLFKGVEQLIHPLEGCCPPVLLIERPRVYPGARQAVPVNDIITLAVTAGEYSGAFQALTKWAKVEWVAPNEWKGTIPKDLHHKRVQAALTPAELKIITEAEKGIAPKERHNMWDAIGLGLWRTQRTGRAGAHL